ncbi:MAG TPA: permease-like cell division protein FtsX [Candidatus Eremiobacteraceae bacterium]|jgi:cell division transport system permease protein|nr:permease-like cell division protein FtsX [Candidatus Eremiobacteraceae bacterium]
MAASRTTKNEAATTLDWGRTQFFWGEVAQNFTRNAAMALTAIGTVAISIVVLGVFLFARTSFNQLLSNVVNKVDIAVYLKDEAGPADIDTMMRGLRADTRVDNVRFVSKQEALDTLRKRLAGQVNLGLINVNPLPNSFVVHTVDPGDVPALAAALQTKPAVAFVNYGSKVTEKLLVIRRVLGLIGLGVIVLLLVATALIIYNTIRLTVFARQREITIMQLVGATNWTIRWPFVFEGLLTGLAGSFVGLLVLWPAYRTLAPKLTFNLPFLPLDLAAIPVGHLVLELVLVGAFVGMLASWLSVSRYLRPA